MTNIEEKIVKYLSNRVDFTEAAEISKELSVSKKTIYRTVKKINSEKEMIISRRGIGYKIKDSVNTHSYYLEDPVSERHRSILLRLLLKQPSKLKVKEVLLKYFISESVFVNDLSRIRVIAGRFSLQISRNHGFLQVLGKEENIRKAIFYIFSHYGKFTQTRSNEFDDIFPYISGDDKNFLISQLNFIENNLNITILDPYRINIFSHLYILIKRLRQGGTISENDNDLSPSDAEFTRNNFEFFQTSNQVILNVENYLDIKVNKIESFYILRYLVSTRYDRDLLINDPEDVLVEKFSNFIVNNYPFKNKNNVNFAELISDLNGHIKPMINRINSGISMVNPLINDIKSSYGYIFKSISRLVDIFAKKYRLNHISDDEKAFLVLYIAKSIEKTKVNKKIIIMCASGIGTAQLLKVKVSNAFPNLDIVGVISLSEFEKNSINTNDVDLVISSFYVDKKISCPFVVVSALLNDLDKKRIEKILSE